MQDIDQVLSRWRGETRTLDERSICCQRRAAHLLYFFLRTRSILLYLSLGLDIFLVPSGGQSLVKQVLSTFIKQLKHITRAAQNTLLELTQAFHSHDAFISPGPSSVLSGTFLL
jgi:hypothetical protein